MSDALNQAYESIDRSHADSNAATRRKFVAGAAATVGSMGLLGFPDLADARFKKAGKPEFRGNLQEILNVAASVEVLATCINTIAHEKGIGGDEVTKGNIAAAGRHELLHHDELVTVAAGHIHRGPSGSAGRIVVAFFAKPVDRPSGCVDGVAKSLIREIETDPDGFYVNVHNKRHPAGAVRGQLRG